MGDATEPNRYVPRLIVRFRARFLDKAGGTREIPTREIPIAEGRLTIGRASDRDLVLEYATAGRLAELVRSGSCVTLHENRKGDVLMYVNGQPPRCPRLLADGDSLTFACDLYELVFRDTPGDPLRSGEPAQAAAPARQPVDTPLVDSSTLHHSIIAASLRAEHVSGRNLIWCGTFQWVWNLLIEAAQGPVQLDGDPPIAQALNESSNCRADLDTASYLALAGFGREDIVARIQREFTATFGAAKAAPLLPPVRPIDRVGYSCLSKLLDFETPFATEDAPLSFADGVEVESFGLGAGSTRWAERAEQVRVLRYENASRFALELRSASWGDRLVLARTRAGVTLGDTISTALADRDPAGEPLRRIDELRIPKIDFAVQRGYQELTGRRVLNPGWTGGEIGAAQQDIRFRLNERGASLESRARVFVIGSTAGPRRLIFNGPFLVALLRKGATDPYFAAWIEHPELLVPRQG